MQTKNVVPMLSAEGYRRRQRAFDEQPAKPTTYYGRPMLKKPTWKWFIPLYLFLGGVAGGVALLGALAELLGGPRHRATVRHARYLSLLLSILCPIFLILDLGRPARFHHMLRVFKVSSPLSVGTWILSAFGLCSGALAVRQAAEDDVIIRRRSRLGRMLRAVPTAPLAALHGLLGICLGGYTGTLLAATAVPLWQAGGVLLGPLFLSDAVTSGAAMLSLVGAATGEDSLRAREDIENVDSLGTVAQLGLVVARAALMPPRVRRPLRRGFWGGVWRFGAIGAGMIAPLSLRLALRLGRWKPGRALSIIISALSLLGALAERFALTEAGKISAEDPLAYQDMTRGLPGEARPTPLQQVVGAPAMPARKPQVAAMDT
ncbi:MAG TPA: NrfD/PsrC family molybdoenzyme membrane anchor subunit [Ktedonobacterales bacterium]|nr:NrfD/PsrC family molybdoenzyme membrane anchor subunit [Ktedonobacterales bacterium]